MSQNTIEHSKKGRARRKNPLDPNVDGKQRATIMKCVHMARKRGERIEVIFYEKRQLEGKHGDELMSWIGVLAREHLPIWIQDWRSRDLDGLKFKKNEKWEKRDGLWLDQQTCADGELKDLACKKVSELILLVAFGRAWLESLPSDTVHGILLGEGNVRVSINVPKLKKAALPIPTYEATTVEDAVNGFVAWPKTLVELDISMNKVSRGPSHVPDPAADRKKCQKKLGKRTVDSRTEVQQDAQQQEALFDFNKMNMEMRPLAYYAHSSMRQANQIMVPIPYTMMGFDIPVFLSFDDTYEFINLQEISANCILVYMRYLEELCKINGQAEKFVLVSPTLISSVRIDTEDAGMRERADNLVSFLRDAPK
ncbi:hypothetical protein TIFTF001_027225 [Ficus carica]|uniref:DUF8039 domain-containing protein n=1 Tax=Ficus carica TaxID=3494 RepID=A0AA88DMJ7_FICCA|nr:hypothetical protein TIFTF001_027225 [Ficus carica]